MIHMLARRVALLGMESGHPYVVLREAGPPTGKTVLPDKRRDRVLGFELIPGRLPDVVLHVGIDDLPVAHGFRISAPTSLQFRLQRGGLVIMGVAIAVVRSFVLRTRVVLDDAIRIAIDGHIQARAEDVLVDLSGDAGRNLVRIFSGLAGYTRHGIDDAGSLDLKLNRDVDEQIP